jgi:hypothetical protein
MEMNKICAVLFVIRAHFCGSSYALIRLKIEFPGSFRRKSPYKILTNLNDLRVHTRSQAGMRTAYDFPYFLECLIT